MRPLIAAVLLAAAASSPLARENYPTRPIKIVVPLPPGPIADLLPRLIADKLAARWGQPVLVEIVANNIKPD